MSAHANLSECYVEELKDLISANDQMKKVVKKLAKVANDEKLKTKLTSSVDGIDSHTDMLKELLSEAGGKGKEHCRGMEGLVAEAEHHVLEEEFEDDDVRDVVIVTQFQRMSHYGICGFGTAAAFAGALGHKAHVKKLDKATSDIYKSDENMTMLAEQSVNLKAKEDAATGAEK